MKRNWLAGIAAGLLACAVPMMAQEQGYWRAESKTAHDVTGDVGLSDARLAMNFYLFNMVKARDLTPAETSAVFDTDSNSDKKAHLYGLLIPANKKFLHKSTLCGTDDTHWLLAYAEGNELSIAFFSGEQIPTFTVDAIANSSSFCGVYRYTR